MNFAVIVLCAFAAGTGPAAVGADTPPALHEALVNLERRGSYTWFTTTDASGAPVSVPAIKGRRGADGALWIESGSGKQARLVAGLHGARVARIGTLWQRPEELKVSSPRETAEVQALLATPTPSDELRALLKGAQSPVPRADGSLAVELSPEMASSLLLAMIRGRAPGGFTPELKSASGQLELWLKQGALERYRFTCRATAKLPFGEREIRRVTSVQLHELDPADVSLPSGAREKLVPSREARP